jgi:hypothetical protein
MLIVINIWQGDTRCQIPGLLQRLQSRIYKVQRTRNKGTKTSSWMSSRERQQGMKECSHAIACQKEFGTQLTPMVAPKTPKPHSKCCRWKRGEHWSLFDGKKNKKWTHAQKKSLLFSCKKSSWQSCYMKILILRGIFSFQTQLLWEPAIFLSSHL